MSDTPIPTEFVDAKGVTYVAKNDATYDCRGCAFDNDMRGCVNAPDCDTYLETEGKVASIIWVRKQ